MKPTTPRPVARLVSGMVGVALIAVAFLRGNHLLGLGFGTYPKFAKPYADLRRVITDAVHAFRDDVHAGTFPDDAHSYR